MNLSLKNNELLEEIENNAIVLSKKILELHKENPKFKGDYKSFKENNININNKSSNFISAIEGGLITNSKNPENLNETVKLMSIISGVEPKKIELGKNDTKIISESDVNSLVKDSKTNTKSMSSMSLSLKAISANQIDEQDTGISFKRNDKNSENIRKGEKSEADKNRPTFKKQDKTPGDGWLDKALGGLLAGGLGALGLKKLKDRLIKKPNLPESGKRPGRVIIPELPDRNSKKPTDTPDRNRRVPRVGLPELPTVISDKNDRSKKGKGIALPTIDKKSLISDIAGSCCCNSGGNGPDGFDRRNKKNSKFKKISNIREKFKDSRSSLRNNSRLSNIKDDAKSNRLKFSEVERVGPDGSSKRGIFKKIAIGGAGLGVTTAGINYATSPSTTDDNITNKKNLEQAALKAGITDKKELAMFMGQMGHESAGFNQMNEGTYSAKSVWEQRGKELKKYGVTEDMVNGANKTQLYDYMYNDKYRAKGYKMGNTEAGDGEKYKGRGFTQLTGKNNYASMTKDLQNAGINVDLVKNPELAADPKIAEKIATIKWKTSGAQNVARNGGSITDVTKKINGGTNGLDDRVSRVEKYSDDYAKSGVPGIKNTAIESDKGKPLTNKKIPDVQAKKPAKEMTDKALNSAKKLMGNLSGVKLGLLSAAFSTYDGLQRYNSAKNDAERKQVITSIAVEGTIVTAGGTAGSWIGGALGTVLAPGAGTVGGSIVGGVGASIGAGYIADFVMDNTNITREFVNGEDYLPDNMKSAPDWKKRAYMVVSVLPKITNQTEKNKVMGYISKLNEKIKSMKGEDFLDAAFKTQSPDIKKYFLVKSVIPILKQSRDNLSAYTVENYIKTLDKLIKNITVQDYLPASLKNGKVENQINYLTKVMIPYLTERGIMDGVARVQNFITIMSKKVTPSSIATIDKTDEANKNIENGTEVDITVGDDKIDSIIDNKPISENIIKDIKPILTEQKVINADNIKTTKTNITSPITRPGYSFRGFDEFKNEFDSLTPDARTQTYNKAISDNDTQMIDYIKTYKKDIKSTNKEISYNMGNNNNVTPSLNNPSSNLVMTPNVFIDKKGSENSTVGINSNTKDFYEKTQKSNDEKTSTTIVNNQTVGRNIPRAEQVMKLKDYNKNDTINPILGYMMSAR